jgi:hypothetical protein
MQIERRETVDYEPFSLELVANEGTALVADDVEAFALQWLEKRAVGSPVCRTGCTFKYVSAAQINDGVVRLLVQWVCDECEQVLCRALGEQFRNLQRIYVGHSVQDTGDLVLPASSIGFSERPVTHEDGRIEIVGKFEIASVAISVDELARFCRETGFVTSGERVGHHDTYLRNGLMDMLPAERRGVAAADFLSYSDAVAYCSWANCRLPTEGEFLAAALIDDEVHDSLPMPEEIQRLYASGRIVRFGGDVITSNREGPKVVVIRGPNVVKRPNDRGNRWLVDDDFPAGKLFPVLLTG